MEGGRRAMKFAVISDTHFGDPASVLVTRNASGQYLPGSRYGKFLQAAGTGNDYLVLLGDILDFSVASYEDAIAAARVFFLQIQRDGVAREMIYLPGNHDFDMWHTVEYETNIINRLKDHKPPRPFRLSVPGVLDLRPQTPPSDQFRLFGVSRQEESDRSSKYAGLFLDDITAPEGPNTAFNFVYPNLYVVLPNGSSVLLTHGQYLEPYWSLAGEWLIRVAGGDLKVATPPALRELVALNFPSSQLACSGVGQAGPLTSVVRAVEHEVKDHNVSRVRRYLERFRDEIEARLDLGVVKRWLVDKVFAWVEKQALASLAGMDDARYSDEFVHDPAVRKRFLEYFAASLLEIVELNMAGYRIPPPETFVFGHTHQPLPLNDPNAPRISPTAGNDTFKVTLLNTGGWLVKQGANGPIFCGAAVFKYDPTTGWSSVSVT
jgi:Calcineurin-like phosphoesterase